MQVLSESRYKQEIPSSFAGDFLLCPCGKLAFQHEAAIKNTHSRKAVWDFPRLGCIPGSCRNAGGSILFPTPLLPPARSLPAIHVGKYPFLRHLCEWQVPTVQQICSVVGSIPCWEALWAGIVPTVNCRKGKLY